MKRALIRAMSILLELKQEHQIYGETWVGELGNHCCFIECFWGQCPKEIGSLQMNNLRKDEMMLKMKPTIEDKLHQFARKKIILFVP